MSLQFISTFNFHSVPPICSWFSQEAYLKAWQESIWSIWSCTNGSCYSVSYRSPITTTLWFWIKRTRITSCCEYGLAQRALDLIWGSVGGTGTVQWAQWFPAALGFNGLGRRALTLKILFLKNNPSWYLCLGWRDHLFKPALWPMLAQLLSGHIACSVSSVTGVAHSLRSCFQLFAIAPGAKRPQMNQRLLLNSLVNSALMKTREKKK